MKNVAIASFPEYNARRYSMPWVCEMKEDGSYDFKRDFVLLCEEIGLPEDEEEAV